MTQIELRNLKKGLMHFCVSARNGEGVSEKLVGPKDPVLIKDPHEVPGVPQGLKIEDSTDKSVTLTWTAPNKDGGAPITAYNVEQNQEGSEKWVSGMNTNSALVCIESVY